jgi:hypothetical protein
VDRIARQKEAKQQRDRERKRVQRGCISRQLYEERSTARDKPWIRTGVSRATWYRQRETGVSTRVLFSQNEATDLSHGVAPKRTHTEPGPARLGSDYPGVGADVPSHSGKTRNAAVTEGDEQPPTRGAGQTCGARSEPRGDQHGRAA